MRKRKHNCLLAKVFEIVVFNSVPPLIGYNSAAVSDWPSGAAAAATQPAPAIFPAQHSLLQAEITGSPPGTVSER